ncbi:MAG TPA: hypothetical protein VFB16_15605 [Bauldia sp.]|nr:hypothetical protein [Bauldia sp.]
MGGKNDSLWVSADDPRFARALDARIGEMRRLLAAMGPTSAANALRALRTAFPEVPLDQRVRVLGEVLH